MDVCVLRCTPRHIPRYMSRTSNNNKRCQLWIHCMLYPICFLRILHRTSGLWSLLYYTGSHLVLPLVFYSTSLLLLSYYTMSIPCLISLAIYLPASACLCSRYSFQYIIMIQFYRYTWAYLCTPLGIHITTRRGVLTPLDPHVQVLELEVCGSSQLLTWEVQRSMDLQQTVWSPILPGPPARL